MTSGRAKCWTKLPTQIVTGLANEPEVQARLMQVMGDVYGTLDSIRRRSHLLTRAVRTRRRVLRHVIPIPLPRCTVWARFLLQGRYAEAEKLDRETLDIQRRVLGIEDPDTLRSMNSLASVLDEDGRYAEAEKLDHETLDIQRRVLGPEHPGTLTSMSNLANVFWSEGRYAEAEKLGRETLDIRRRVLGLGHPETLSSMMILASDLHHDGRFAEAEMLDRETLDIQRRRFGAGASAHIVVDEQPSRRSRRAGPLCGGRDVGARDTAYTAAYSGAGESGHGNLIVQPRLLFSPGRQP